MLKLGVIALALLPLCQAATASAKDGSLVPNILDEYDLLADEDNSEDDQLVALDDQLVGIEDHHKIALPLYPITASKVLTFVLAGFFLMLAAGGGIGGGGILVPLYAIVIPLSLHFAVPLSNMTICFCAVVNLFNNARSKHPTADRPLIDWDLILIMEPLTIAGALIGSLINVLLPAWVTTIMLVVLLGLTAFRSLQKGIRTYKAETKAAKIALEEESSETQVKVDNEKLGPVEADKKTRLAALLITESKFPWHKMLLLVAIAGTILILELARAKDNSFGIHCDTTSYWLVTFAVFPFTVAMLLFQRKHLIKEYYLKVELGYQFQPGDVRWDETATLKYPLICACAGLFAGMFGIGGGIVKGPLMIEMGVQPAVASACSATMIFFTGAAAGISYALYGMVPWDYVAVMGPIGVISTFIGLVIMKKLIQRTGHPSYIILCIGAVVALSAVMMAVYGAVHFSTPGQVAKTLSVHQKICSK